jgi:PAS domain S-box-containing protein
MQNEELRIAQEELDASRARYFDLYDLAPVGYCTISEKGLILEANLTAATLLNITREELVNHPISRFILKEDQDIYYLHRKQLFETGEPQVCELQMVKNDGTLFWARLDATAVQDENSAPVCRVVLSDITKQRQTEETLRERQQKLTLVQGLAKIGDCSWNVETGEVTWSDGLYDLLGYDRSEIIDIAMVNAKIHHPGDLARVTKWLSDCIGSDDRELVPNEYRLICKNGKVIWVRTIGMIERTENRHVKVFAAIQDITEFKQAKAKIHQLQKAESLSCMAGAIAHRYNNLLTVVMGNLELAMEELPMDSETAKKLKDAMNSAHRASNLSGMMLAYLGQSVAPRELIDLSDTCRRFLSELQGMIPGNLTLTADLPVTGLTVMANEDQIRQVLENLISNASEALGVSPGVISLMIQRASPADIPSDNRYPADFQPKASDGYACLKVTDLGCGISEKDMGKIFDPFYSTKFTGRGLGLPVAIGTIKTHDGCITVESTPGRGSDFRVFLPLINKTIPRPRAVPRPETTLMMKSGSMLLVEDDPLVRDVANQFIVHLGYKVLQAGDGIEAVEVFQKHRNEIRFVLCDLTMPRMNGWEAIEALRKLAPGIPVILTSGYDQAYAMEGTHSELPQAFLRKPYQLTKLKEAIVNALTKKK